MDREKRNEIVQDYVDIHAFAEVVKMLKDKQHKAEDICDSCTDKDEKLEEYKKEGIQDEEVLQ